MIISDGREKQRQGYQTGGSDFTVQKPERDNQKTLLFRVQPDLRRQRKRGLTDILTFIVSSAVYISDHSPSGGCR